jgi:hypothetical protein
MGFPAIEVGLGWVTSIPTTIVGVVLSHPRARSSTVWLIPPSFVLTFSATFEKYWSCFLRILEGLFELHAYGMDAKFGIAKCFDARVDEVIPTRKEEQNHFREGCSQLVG